MRYHFHLVGPSGTIFDHTGREASCLKKAAAEARQAIQEMWDESPGGDEEWHGWTLQIADASDRVLLTISLEPARDEARSERSWPAVRQRAAMLHGLLLAVGGGVPWPNALARI